MQEIVHKKIVEGSSRNPHTLAAATGLGLEFPRTVFFNERRFYGRSSVSRPALVAIDRPAKRPYGRRRQCPWTTHIPLAEGSPRPGP